MKLFFFSLVLVPQIDRCFSHTSAESHTSVLVTCETAAQVRIYGFLQMGYYNHYAKHSARHTLLWGVGQHNGRRSVVDGERWWMGNWFGLFALIDDDDVFGGWVFLVGSV
ncbi:hypothetical protein RP20_CCG012354 [Aedes albopictus]|nr:hypothetical protein RP20_CCG012354 [Aedes albopictus]